MAEEGIVDAGRHIKQSIVAARGGVAEVAAAFESIAERPARTPAEEEAEPGRIVPNEILAEVDGPGEVVTGLEIARRNARILPVEQRRSVILRGRLRRRQVAAVVGVGEGVAEADARMALAAEKRRRIVEGPAEHRRQRVAAEAVRIRQLDLVVARGGETFRRLARIDGRRSASAHEFGVAARRRRIDRAIDRPSVDSEPADAERRIDSLGEIDEGEGIAKLAVDGVDIDPPAVEETARRAAEIGRRRETEIGANDSRQLQIRVSRLGVGERVVGQRRACGDGASGNAGKGARCVE